MSERLALVPVLACLLWGVNQWQGFLLAQYMKTSDEYSGLDESGSGDERFV
jgi:hypothetical protein